MATSDAYKILAEKVAITPDTNLDQYIYYSDLQTSESIDMFYHTGS